MRVLLDTQVYLWWLLDSPRLNAVARSTIEGAEAVFVSAASIWEATIKVSIGKLEAEPNELVEGIAASGFEELPVRGAHVLALHGLAQHHRDPFDRILIAQAISEPLFLLTADALLHKYSELVVTV